jgi:hypothetical protein
MRPLQTLGNRCSVVSLEKLTLPQRPIHWKISAVKLKGLLLPFRFHLICELIQVGFVFFLVSLFRHILSILSDQVLDNAQRDEQEILQLPSLQNLGSNKKLLPCRCFWQLRSTHQNRGRCGIEIDLNRCLCHCLWQLRVTHRYQCRGRCIIDLKRGIDILVSST